MMPYRKNRSSRKNRNTRNRRSQRNRRTMMGGMAPVNDQSMSMPMKDSLAQGGQYLNIHKGQYGGGMGSYPGAVVQGSLIKAAQAGGAVGPYPASVMSSSLPTNMVPSARTGPLDAAIAGIQGMQDGGRRRNRRSSRRNRRNRSSRRNRRNRSNRRNRRHSGGGELILSPSEVSANPMLLPSGMEKQAALNYEWSMAKDPSAFLPKAT